MSEENLLLQGTRDIATRDILPSLPPLPPRSQACSASSCPISLPPFCRMNFTEEKLRTWENEPVGFWSNLPRSVQWFLVSFPRLCWIWCSDDFASWLKQAWWVNYCFPEKATLSRRDWKGEKKPYVWWNSLYVIWHINMMTHKLPFFQQCSWKKPISSGKSQKFQCWFKRKMLN